MLMRRGTSAPVNDELDRSTRPDQVFTIVSGMPVSGSQPAPCNKYAMRRVMVHHNMPPGVHVELTGKQFTLKVTCK